MIFRMNAIGGDAVPDTLRGLVRKREKGLPRREAL